MKNKTWPAFQSFNDKKKKSIFLFLNKLKITQFIFQNKLSNVLKS